MDNGLELRAAREKLRRSRISAAISHKYATQPLYRERIQRALAPHWENNRKRLTGVWKLRDRVRELERTLSDLRAIASAALAPGIVHPSAWGDALANVVSVINAANQFSNLDPAAPTNSNDAKWVGDI